MYNEAMLNPVLATKLHIPSLPPKPVLRPRLVDQLENCIHCKLIMISAAAGFGKTTILSEWISKSNKTAVWLSLDSEHREPAVFLTYLIAGIQKLSSQTGSELLTSLQSPQPPSSEFILTSLINEISEIQSSFLLVLDDYHDLDSADIDNILSFLLKNLPHNLRIVIATREDPRLPLAKLRGQGNLLELRINDLRFTSSEISDFLNSQMNLNLTEKNLSALENRTEGWITGLQLAAISMQGNNDTEKFIESFTGSHHFILDYLIEEVLHQQPEYIQSFLLQTSILNRMCAPLCDAIVRDSSLPAKEVLRNLELSNMFIIALDNERQWYRYHHLFAELLKQRLQSDLTKDDDLINELHIRASQWFEDNDYYIEAFQHAAAVNDIDRTIRLIEGDGIHWHSRANIITILNWLKKLPENVLNSRPVLWITYANVILGTGQTTNVEKILQSAEYVLSDAESDENNRDLIGRIAAMRSILGVTRYDPQIIKKQSVRALEYLSEDNLTSRTTATWTLALSYEMSGDRTSAKKIFNDAVRIGELSRNYVFTLLSKTSLASFDAEEIHLQTAVKKFHDILEKMGKQPLPVLSDVYHGLAKIYYQWNEIDKASDYIKTGIEIAKLFENTIDRYIICEVFLSRIKMMCGETDTASSLLTEISNSVKKYNFIQRMKEVAEMQSLLLLKENQINEAEKIADEYELNFIKVRIKIAQKKYAAALSISSPLFNLKSENEWDEEKLNTFILHAVVLHLNNDKENAVKLIEKILTVTEPENFIRIFVDEGIPMFNLLSDAYEKSSARNYISKILSVFKSDNIKNTPISSSQSSFLIESLSQREIEVLKLIAEGFSNKEICDKLFIALDTVKGHNRRIFGKLGVESRAHAVNKARSLNLIS